MSEPTHISDILPDVLAEAEAKLTPALIIETVAAFYSVKPADIRSSRRFASLVRVRSIAIYLVRILTTLSLEEIGGVFNRDHSTVIHAINSIIQKMASDAELAKQVALLESEISPDVPAART